MLQLHVKFDIYVWASPCPEDDSLRGNTYYENNWLLGSMVNISRRPIYQPNPQRSTKKPRSTKNK